MPPQVAQSGPQDGFKRAHKNFKFFKMALQRPRVSPKTVLRELQKATRKFQVGTQETRTAPRKLQHSALVAHDGSQDGLQRPQDSFNQFSRWFPGGPAWAPRWL